MLNSVLAVMNSDHDQLHLKTMILHINLNAHQIDGEIKQYLYKEMLAS